MILIIMGLKNLYNLLPEELEYLIDKQGCFYDEKYRVMSDCWYKRNNSRQLWVLTWQNS